LSSLLFVIVIEALSRELRVALRWELLYADDLVLIAETEDDLIERLNEWKDNVYNRCMKVNMNETNVMISTEWQKVMKKPVRWPCGVCCRGIGSNSIQCTSCRDALDGIFWNVAITRFCRISDEISSRNQNRIVY